MTPWLWYWSPVIHFPWSGNLAQDIEPYTNWFSALIPPQAGDAVLEKKAVSVASYGKQLGLITEVLLDVVGRSGLSSDQALASLEKLKAIKSDIEALKSKEYALRADDLLAQVERFQSLGGEAYEALAKNLRPLVAERKH